MRTDIVVIDIETQSVLNDRGCVVPWEGKIIGIGLCWGKDFETESAFYIEDEIDSIIKWLAAEQIPLVAYNTLFEMNWLHYHYPDLKFNWTGDAAILAIAMNNSLDSFSLKNTATHNIRYPNWEEAIRNYCVQTFKCGPEQWGNFIPLLPHEMLQDYCRKDCHATFLLWQEGVKLGIDHIHDFFMAEVFLTSEAYLTGTLIDREKVARLHQEYSELVANAENKFMTHPDLVEHIELANKKRYEKKIAKDLEKSKTGRVRPMPYETWLEKFPFKTSTQQLAEVFKSQKLFWNPSKLIHEWPELTPAGAPCLDVDHIHLYGVGGQILAEAGLYENKVMKLTQILEGSAHDGRTHFDINLCSVRSTRVSSSGLNIVATPLDNEIGECFIADEGWSFVLVDGTSLEPVIAAMLCNDEMLKYCASDGAGKVPYWKNGTLYVDDVYLYYLSATERWHNDIKNGFSIDEWMENPEKVKKKFKVIRQAGKKLVLMTQYGSGINKICTSIYKELGIKIEISEGHALLNTLWTVFPDLYRYIQILKGCVNAGRDIKTWLGFPITATSDVMHCIFNYRVQTEAAHFLKQYLWHIWQRKQPWFVPAVVNIHDATCFQVHDDKIEDFKKVLNDSLDDLNTSLAAFTNGLRFRIETHVGKTLRQAKEG